MSRSSPARRQAFALAFSMVAVIGVGALPAPLHAQAGMHGRAAMATRMDCAGLAAQKHATLSVEACERKKAALLSLQDASATPGGERPGDEAMTCTQLIAELQSMGPGIDPALGEKARIAGEAVRETYDRQNAAAKAMAARQAAESIAAMAGPNIVQGIVGAKHSAESVALGTAGSQAMRGARDQASFASADASDALAQRMRDDPRFARLLALVQRKNCGMGDMPKVPGG